MLFYVHVCFRNNWTVESFDLTTSTLFAIVQNADSNVKNKKKLSHKKIVVTKRDAKRKFYLKQINVTY